MEIDALGSVDMEVSYGYDVREIEITILSKNRDRTSPTV